MAAESSRAPISQPNIANCLQAATKAVADGDETRITARLDELKEALLKPEALRYAWYNGVQELLSSCLSSTVTAAQRAATRILADSLLSLKDVEVAEANIELVFSLLAYINREILHQPTRRDLFAAVFLALAEWCSCGTPHRLTFLDVLSLGSLFEFDYNHYPSDTLNAFASLVASLVRHGKLERELLWTALRIFDTTLHGGGGSCQLTTIVCEAMSDLLSVPQYFGFHDHFTDSRIVDGLSAHVLSPSECQRQCLKPMMKLFVDVFTLSSFNCLRAIDQGALNVVSICLSENHRDVIRLVCAALRNVLAGPSEHVGCVMTYNLLGPLFVLQDDPTPRIKDVARQAMKNFLVAANCGHLRTLITTGFTKEIVKLLRSPDAGVCLDGMCLIFALISTLRDNAPTKLPELRKQLEELGVAECCSNLKTNPDPEVQSAAKGLYVFVEKEVAPEYIDDDVPSTSRAGS